MRLLNRIQLALVATTAVLMTQPLVASAASAADFAGTDAWSFQGTVQAVAKGSNTVKVTGDLIAPPQPSRADGRIYSLDTGLWAIAAVCLVKQGNPVDPFVYVFNDRSKQCSRNMRFTPSVPGKYAMVGTSAGSRNYVDWTLTANEGPGMYDVQIFSGTANEYAGVPQLLSGAAAVQIIAQTSYKPTIIANRTSAPVGGTVKFTVGSEVTWSDGTGSNLPDPKSCQQGCQLQVRPTGTQTWIISDYGPTSTGRVKKTFEARYLVNGRATDSIVIRAVGKPAKNRA